MIRTIDPRDVIEATDWWLNQCNGDEFAEDMVLGFASDLLELSRNQVLEEIEDVYGSQRC